MKKFLYLILTFIIATASLLGGCGCNSDLPLEFKDYFYGDLKVTPPTGYIETCEYSVTYKNGFEGEFTKNPAVTDKMLKMEISGKYTTKLTVQGLMDAQTPILGKNVNSELKNSFKNVNLYKYETELVLDKVEYLVNGTSADIDPYDVLVKDEWAKARYGEQAVTNGIDYIYTVTYFAPGPQSFTPIYTEQISSFTNVMISENSIDIGRRNSENYIEYNTNNYTVNTEYSGGDVTLTGNKRVNYTSSTAIDNTQLLFVIRNMNLSSGSSSMIPVASYQYQNLKDISIVGESSRTENISDPTLLKVNGANFSGNSIKLNRYAFRLAETSSAGIKQLVYVQSEDCCNLGNRKLMYRYVEPLSALSYQSLGVMEYKLTEVNFG